MNTPGNFGRRLKCPCCTNNPWAQAGDENAICPRLTDNKGYSGIDTDNFDLTVSPKENFYQFANGGWRAKNPIPAEYSNWNTFTALMDLNAGRLKDILEELEASNGSQSAEHTKLADFYNSFMDEKKIQESNKDLNELIELCSKASEDPTSTLAILHSKYGVRALFELHSSPDKKNVKHSICLLMQSGLGMPDRDYYFDAGR
jgi:putative endopeptidase